MYTGQWHELHGFTGRAGVRRCVGSRGHQAPSRADEDIDLPLLPVAWNPRGPTLGVGVTEAALVVVHRQDWLLHRQDWLLHQRRAAETVE